MSPRPGGYTVTFDHERRQLSGTLEVTYVGGGDSVTWVLTRSRRRLQLAMNSERRTVSVTDESGGRASGTFDFNEARRRTDSQSEKMLRENRQDLDLGSAIASDLSPRTRAKGAFFRNRPGGRTVGALQQACQSETGWGATPLTS